MQPLVRLCFILNWGGLRLCFTHVVITGLIEYNWKEPSTWQGSGSSLIVTCALCLSVQNSDLGPAWAVASASAWNDSIGGDHVPPWFKLGSAAGPGPCVAISSEGYTFVAATSVIHSCWGYVFPRLTPGSTICTPVGGYASTSNSTASAIHTPIGGQPCPSPNPPLLCQSWDRSALPL